MIGEDKSTERYKAIIQIGEDHKYIACLKSILSDFLGLNFQAKKIDLGSFDLILERLAKVHGKAENHAI